MPWTIETYVGTNDLRFGMTPDQVAARAGAPDRARTRAPGRISEYRSLDMPIVEYRDSRADEFIFSPQADLVFRGISVFADSSESVLRRLLELDPNLAEVGGGAIVSALLGVSLSGYQDEDDSNKSFGAFRQGVWDAMLAKARPVVL